MLHQSVERKGSLLARFIVDHLRDYTDQVKENLSLYLNTAEKIRVKISRNSFTLTDRTVFHNKIERIPISLIKECEVDHVSPKICYFANETVSSKYQVIVLLCKTADDSFRIVNLIKQKVKTQGYYKAHSQWLQKGTFSSDNEQTTPQSKRRTLASVEVVSSPKEYKKYAWGLRQSPSINSSRAQSTRSSTAESLRSQPTHKGQGHKHANTNLEDNFSRCSGYRQMCRTDSMCSSKSSVTKSSKSNSLLASQPTPSTDKHSDGKGVLVLTNRKPVIHGSRRSASCDKPTSDRDSCNSIEQGVVMRKVRGRNWDPLSGFTASTIVESAMKSSIMQYDSDAETGEPAEHLQQNSNGIARIVVGGNEKSDNSNLSTPTEHSKELSPTASQLCLTRTEQGAEPETGNDDRQSGDGAAGSDDFINSIHVKKSCPVENNACENLVVSTTNSLEGVYDNVGSRKGSDDILESVSDMIRSFDMSECNQKKGSVSQHEENEEEEYELVLTGLKHLTEESSKTDGRTKKSSNLRQTEVALSSSHPAAKVAQNKVVHEKPVKQIKTKYVEQKADSASYQSKLSTKQQQTKSKVSGDVVAKSTHPQSITNGLHLIRANNDLRRSSRRKGQYRSIAEYEQFQSQVKTENNVSKNLQINTKGHASSPTCSKSLKITSHQIANADELFVHDDKKTRPHSTKTQVPSLDAGARRTSIISAATSAPTSVVLRRLPSSQSESGAAKVGKATRKSNSFDGKMKPLSMHKLTEENVSQNGLTLVGSRNSLISHDSTSVTTNSKYRQLGRSNKHMSLGEPIILEEKARTSRQQFVPESKRVPLQWTSLSGGKKHQKVKYISILPNAPDSRIFQHQASASSERPTHWNEPNWNQRPDFKRFFDSILTYGPHGTKSHFKQSHNKASKIHSNPPDVVLESLPVEHSKREDDSDTDSSIRSSASAYWPPELKQQSNCEADFEEAASWQFHNPVDHKRKFVNL